MNPIRLEMFIRELAGTKRFIPRAPLRVAYSYEYKYGSRDLAHQRLKNDLHRLEQLGLIQRHAGCIEVIPRLTRRQVYEHSR